MIRNPEVNRFYHSPQWKKVSRAYMQTHNYVCERCGGVGTVCHHRRYLTPLNVKDYSVSLNFENLECLCMDCHNKEHFAHNSDCTRKVVFDTEGNVVCVVEDNDENPPIAEKLSVSYTPVL